MTIYLSSGFFTTATRKMVEIAAKELREQGHEVFVPMEHQIPNAWDMPEGDWANAVFKADVKAIDECDKIIMLDFGASGDCGTAWEAGYAYAKGIPYEVWSFGLDMSIMVWARAEKIGHYTYEFKLV